MLGKTQPCRSQFSTPTGNDALDQVEDLALPLKNQALHPLDPRIEFLKRIRSENHSYPNAPP